MNYAEIKKCDVANGPGIRVSLFVSGCEHYCKGCFNKEAWNFDYGKEFTAQTLFEIKEELMKPYISGITILGGEPMHPKNCKTVANLILYILDNCAKSIWLYSGYTIDELEYRIHKDNKTTDEEELAENTKTILEHIDVLVDGRFEADKKDLKLRFKGSSNQRIINMNQYRLNKEIVEPKLPN